MAESDDENTKRGYGGNCIGDTTYHPKSLKFHDDTLSQFLPNEYRAQNYSSTMESQIRKLRLSMEEYRELILNINDILLWKKQWHPTAILTAITVLFTLLWLSSPNVLTVISSIGLIITIADYILPTIVASIFKSADWDVFKQNQYEEICTNIILYKTKFELLVASYYRMRVTNTKMYFTVTILVLAVLTWIGSAVNNLLLSYFFVLMILLLPGMICNGFLHKGTEALSKVFADLVENAKSKVGQKKLD